MSSKLLINEPPLQVLPSLAVKLGLNEAIFLQQLHYWLSNPKMGREVDGRKWISNSVKQWKEDNFPFWSEDTIQRSVKSLINQGAVETRNDLNSSKFDRTLWYTINYDLLNREPQVAVITKPQVAVTEDSSLRCSLYTETTSETTTKKAAATPLPEKPETAKQQHPWKAILDAYVKWKDANQPGCIINYPAETKAAKAIAQQNWTPDQVVRCCDILLSDSFYQNNSLSLWTVGKQIGAKVKRGSVSSAAAPVLAPDWMSYSISEDNQWTGH